MDLNEFLKVISITSDIISIILAGNILYQLIKKNIDKILKVVSHNRTKKIINIFLFTSSALFLLLTIMEYLLTILKYDIFSSMFLFRMGAIVVFTLLSQGYFYYLHSDYSKDRLKYLQS
jgi:DNA integrity scanning protein DisA with diadenylate cyclase activity